MSIRQNNICNEKYRFSDIAKIEKIELENTADAEITVSIMCTTYNHKNYIKNALEGFVNQKTDFRYEIVIYDDASTDGTAEIVREYAESYPDLIKAHLAHINTYNHPERKKLIKEYRAEILKGKYIALCEGDDYWIYDQKLQKQYEWMEKHPNTSLCIHNAIRYDAERGEVLPQLINRDTGFMEAEEIFLGDSGAVPTASFFLRKKFFDTLSDSYYICPVGDDPLRYWLAYNGDIYYMNKVWSVRNYMHKGSWNYSMKANEDLRVIHLEKYLLYCSKFDQETNRKFHSVIRRKMLGICEMNLLLKFKEQPFDCKSLRERVDECSHFVGKEIKIRYKEAFLILLNRCYDYLDVVIKTAKVNEGEFYIYGAGIEAKKHAQFLIDKGIEFEGFVVSEKSKEERKLMGYVIKSFDELENPSKFYFWLCMNGINKQEVLDKLLQAGINRII